MIEGVSPLWQAALGTLFTWALTAAGSALVFIFSGGQVLYVLSYAILILWQFYVDVDIDADIIHIILEIIRYYSRFGFRFP